MYSYKFTKSVEKFLEKQDKDFLLRFKSKLDILVKNPFNNNLDIKVLKGLKNSFRLRIGKYRFIFTVENELIIFQGIGSRGDVYN